MGWKGGKAAIVLVALAAAVVPLPATLVERAYSRALFPRWQSVITSTSNAVPIALLDLLIVVVAAGWIILAVLDVRRRPRGWMQAIGNIGWRTLVWAATLYVIFVGSWGLNYRRVPLAERLG